MSRLSAPTMAVLRLLQVIGPTTRKGLADRIGECLPFKGKVVQQLVTRCKAPLGYLEEDNDGRLCLTAKARRVLADAVQLPIGGPRATGPMPPPKQIYEPLELNASARRGSSDATRLPSRAGDRLYWRDGRVTRMDGVTPA